MKILHIVAIALTVPLLLGAGSTSRSTRPTVPTYEKYFNNGVKEQQRKNYSEAVRWYRKAIKTKANYPDAHNNLGFSLRSIAINYLKEADAAYRQALRYQADHAQALEYQGELFVWQGRLVDAQRNLDHLKRRGSPEARDLERELARVLTAARQLE